MRPEIFESVCEVVVRQRGEIERLTEERNQLRAQLEAATVAEHTAPAVPKLDVLGKMVRHSTGRIGYVVGVKEVWVDGHTWMLYTVKRTDGVTGSQIWHASNCTIIEADAKPEPEACLADGQFQHAFDWAVRSLGYSVGVFKAKEAAMFGEPLESNIIPCHD